MDKSQDLGKEIKTETGITTYLNVEELKPLVKVDRETKMKWWKGNKGYAEKAFEYYETSQLPEHSPDSVRFYAQLNMVKDDHQTFMGIMSSSKVQFDIAGRSRSSKDRRNVMLQKETMDWMARESKLQRWLMSALSDFGLCGMGYIGLGWDPFHITKLGTLGGIELRRYKPGQMNLDSRGDTADGLSGYHMFRDPILTRRQFEELYAPGFKERTGKELDIDRIFSATNQADHWDYQLQNQKKKRPHEQQITVLEWDYWRRVLRPVADPATGNLITDSSGKVAHIPVPEYRIALVAGDQVIDDRPSQLSPVKTFSKIVFANNPLYSIPYAVGSFLELRQMQDLVNTMLSMMIDNQARGMNDPLAAIAGTIGQGDNIIKDIGGHKFIFLDFQEEHQAMGLTPKDMFPQRLGFDPQDPGWFRALDWVMAMTQKVTSKDVLKGQQPAGVRSGVALNSLQQAAMQPHYYAKEKLEPPLALLGQAMHELMQRNLTEEVELPISEHSSNVGTITINRSTSLEEMAAILAKANENDSIASDLDMFTIRLGDDRIPFPEFLMEKGPEFFLDLDNAKAVQEKEQFEIVENDVTAGQYDCQLTMDTLAEQNKAEKMANASIVAEALQAVQAPWTALEFMLEITEDPSRVERLSKAQAESQIWQLGLQEKQRMEEEAKNAEKEAGGNVGQETAI